MLSTLEVERLLRGVGLRVTRPRVAVLAAVHDRPHVDTYSMIGIVRERLGAVSHQAVYDVLRGLTAAGLVRRIEPAGSVPRYEARVGDNHHHAVCRSCPSNSKKARPSSCPTQVSPAVDPPPGTPVMGRRAPRPQHSPCSGDPRNQETPMTATNAHLPAGR